MQNYDPAARITGLRDVVIAWIVAVAVCAILLAIPGLAPRHDEDGGGTGLDVAIDTAIPSDTDIVADRQSSR